MICTWCKVNLKCIESRSRRDYQETYRRYKCPKCGVIVHTEEYPVNDEEAKEKIYLLKKMDLCTHREKRK